MIKINGSKNTAKIFSDVPDYDAMAQVENLMNQDFMAGNQVRVMPDYHPGAGCTIGLTSTLDSGKISPNLVGVDIGCGMFVTEFIGNLDFDVLDQIVRTRIPNGRGQIRSRKHHYTNTFNIEDMIDSTFAYQHSGKINMGNAIRSIGSLGGGNHFVEVNQDSSGKTYLVIHSGSRNLGLQIANYFQNLAWEKLSNVSQDDKDALIAEYKANGKQKEIAKALKNLKKQDIPISKDLAYVEGEEFLNYLHDMDIAQKYASVNRQAMAVEIISGMGWLVKNQFETIHNYIDVENMILRKGAVSAREGEILVIPVNMRDGSIIAKGKGNSDWNWSAPHGAGRVLGRRQAKRKLAEGEITLAGFEKEMEGIYSTSIGVGTIDESPFAYKGIEYLLRNIGDSVEIVDIIKPLYNFKSNN